MLIGTTDFYHCIPLSLTLILPGGHKVSAKQNLLASFSPTFFSLSGWNVLWWWSNSSRTAWENFWVGFVETREITAVLLTASQKFHFGMHSNVCKLFWFKLSMIDTIVLYVLILVWFYSMEKTLMMWFYTIYFDIVLYQNTCEPICFKLGIMLNMTQGCQSSAFWWNSAFLGHSAFFQMNFHFFFFFFKSPKEKRIPISNTATIGEFAELR